MSDKIWYLGSIYNDKLEIATPEKDGLMSKEDKSKLDGVEENANNYSHPANHDASIITQDATHRFVSDTEKTNWNAAKTHADSTHAPSNAEYNTIVGIQKNGTDVTVNASTRKANITVPTKVSELTNDSGYITASDVDTTTNHVHANKTVLDKINQTTLDAWDAKVNVDDLPTSLPANGGNADTVGGFTVGVNVPADAKFTDNDTHYMSKNVVGADGIAISNTSVALTNGNVHLNSVENGEVTSSHNIKGSGLTAVTTDTSGNIIINSTHPTTAGNKHIPSGGASGQILKYSASGTAVWANEYSYTHPNDANTRHVTDTQISTWNAKADKPKIMRNITITTDQWTDNLDGLNGTDIYPYCAYVSVPGLTENHSGVANLSPASKALNIITDFNTTDNNLLVYAKDIPSVDIIIDNFVYYEVQ